MVPEYAIINAEQEELPMRSIFPEPIQNLPRADIPLKGLKAYLSQSETHQILFNGIC